MVGSVQAGRVITAVSTAEAQLAVGEAPVAMGEAERSVAEVPLALGLYTILPTGVGKSAEIHNKELSTRGN